MQHLLARLPLASFVLLAGFLVITVLRVGNDTTTQMVLSSLVMFAFSWVSATHLLGARAALKFTAIALAIGWFAEQMGASRGWFFGVYTYTDVLGPKLGVVPVVIPNSEREGAPRRPAKRRPLATPIEALWPCAARPRCRARAACTERSASLL